MGDPVIVERAAHSLSRSQIDPDALKVLYRLHQNSHVAYLVGGSVRDLLLGRRPEGLRHRHVRPSLPGQAPVQELLGDRTPVPARARPVRHEDHRGRNLSPQGDRGGTRRRGGGNGVRAARNARGCASPGPDRLIHRENTFGTPEEDAFRRDFTINALFYDIGTFSIIDYTGGLEDLRAGLVRSIGDPAERFHEDPVRMLRAIAMAARLGFTIDAPIDAAIAHRRAEIARSAPARLIEEFYKLLRSGASERAFRMMAERRLLEPIAHDLQKGAGERLWQIVGRHRRVSEAARRSP